MSPPAPDPLAQALAGLDWLLGRVTRYLERYGARLTGRPDGPTGAHTSVEEARRILSGAALHPAAAALGLSVDPPPGRPPPPESIAGPLARLAARFGLSALEARLLFAAAAPGLSLDIARLYTFAWADFTRKQPPVGFLAELICDDPRAALAAHAAFRARGTLARCGLIALHPADGWTPDPPLVHRGVTVPEPVMAWLRGEPPAPGAGLVHRLAPAPDAEDPELPEAVTARLDEALRQAIDDLDGRPRVVVVGLPGSGRRAAVVAAARRAGVEVLTLDLDDLPPEAAAGALLAAGREARMRGRVLLLTLDATLDPPERKGLSVALDHFARHHAGPLVLATASTDRLDRLPDARVEVVLPLPEAHEQDRRWRDAFAEAGLRHPDDLPATLASQFSVTPGTLRAVVLETAEALRLRPGAPLRPEVDPVLLAEAIHRRSGHALGALAEPVTTTLNWGDVVLPDEVVERLREVRAHARYRTRVFDDWGFRRKLSYGRGLTCLFSGPPGTGKTMMAGILARDLGRAMYKVDLSRVVSKWVGETEKNLGRIFDEAARAQVILFFDEADSLFARRTEVKSSNDRFANMEVNYLLQRMEQYDGMSILTTNFERGLDAAFKRRLRFRVHFPLPEEAERAELWRRMIPDELPRDAELPFARLGRRYKMSGGNIKNAVLRAAFYAAEGEGRLTSALLRKAADAEMREMGRL